MLGLSLAIPDIVKFNSGAILPIASWDASTSTLAQLAVLASHSRTSLATMFDSTGKLTYAPNNLLTYSNTFSNAVWAKNNGGTGVAPIITANAGTDPVGGNAASRIQFSRTNNTQADYSLISQGGYGTSANNISGVWLKSNTGISQNVVLYDGYRLIGRVITVTTSWQLFSQSTLGSASSNSNITFGTYGGTGNFYNGGDATIDVLAYAAFASAVTYETTPRTADQVITTSAAYYGPRIDYDPNTLAVKGLLIEEARTNSVTYSNELSNAAWSRNVVGAPSQNVTGIDGTTSAWTVTASGTADTFLYQTGSFVGPYAYSAVFKAGTDSWAYIAANGGGNKRAYVFFDLTNGVVGSTTYRPDGAYAGTLTGYGIINLGNGFYRCWMAVTGTTDTYVAFGLADGDANVSTTNGRTVIMGELQAEAGAFPTSIVRTTSASVTRAADVVQFTGAAAAVLPTNAGTLITEVGGASYGASNLVIVGNAGAYATVVTSGPKFGMSGFRNAGNSLEAAANFVNGSNNRFGVAWGASTYSMSGNGASVTTGSGTTAFSGTPYVGSTGSSLFLNGWLRSFALYNQRLPDATLQARSVVGASY